MDGFPAAIPGLVFALVAVGAGAAVARAARASLALAPVLGLAVLPTLAVWLILLHVPMWLAGRVLVALALIGAAMAMHAVQPGKLGWTAGLLALAAVLPALLLSLAFAGLEVPTSVHDGAFHVETIDALRH